MSKAEERAQYSGYWTDALNRVEYTANDVRDAFIGGYQQAEKDLELTWEDIPKIFQISEELKTSWWFRDNEQTKLIGTQTFWEEVLKRFKENRY
jgi:hypothetical protein